MLKWVVNGLSDASKEHPQAEDVPVLILEAYEGLETVESRLLSQAVA